MGALWFIIGLYIGGTIGVAATCFCQISKVNYYESEICKLKEQIKVTENKDKENPDKDTEENHTNK